MSVKIAAYNKEKTMKMMLIALMLCAYSTVAWTAQFCIAPIDQRYHQYGQYGDYEVQVGQKTYPVSHTQAVKVSPIQTNKSMQVIIKQQGKAIESFPLKLAKNEKVCLVKNDLYPTWMLVEMRKSCQC